MAGAAAIYATYARRVLVGGLLVEMDPDKFIPLIDSKTTVIHGELGKLKKYHLYFIVRNGITMYCKTMSPLSITPLIEVEKIDTGGVIKLGFTAYYCMHLSKIFVIFRNYCKQGLIITKNH